MKDFQLSPGNSVMAVKRGIAPGLNTPSFVVRQRNVWRTKMCDSKVEVFGAAFWAEGSLAFGRQHPGGWYHRAELSPLQRGKGAKLFRLCGRLGQSLARLGGKRSAKRSG